MLGHYSPLLSSKLIYTITAIITQNFACGNYTCTIILLFCFELHASMRKCEENEGHQASKVHVANGACERSAFFSCILLLGKHPQTPLEHEEVMQLCCETTV